MRIAIVTVSRADWNGLGMVAKGLKAAGEDVHVVATAQQVSIDSTEAIYADDFAPSLVDLDSYGWGSRQIVGVAGRAITRLGMALDVLKPDMLLLGGDRFETLSAAFAASMLRIPIVHLAGGDVTEGSQDDRYRDAITTLACVHCVTNARAYDRLLPDLGRRTWLRPTDHIELTGSPAIDRIKATEVLTFKSTFEALQLESGQFNILVSIHPNSLSGAPAAETAELIKVIDGLDDDVHFVCLGANADAGGSQIDELLQLLCRSRYPRRGIFHQNVSPLIYFSMMTHFDAMIGNSSAAYYEAPSFGLRCIDVGDRQKGRVRPGNIMMALATREDISKSISAIRQFGGRCRCDNPYGDGNAVPKIVKAIQDNSWRCERVKSGMFHDVAV